LLPSYSPKQSLAALLAAKSLGIRTVMMNESHAGTARAKGPTALVKRQLIGMFDAALVGGEPQRRYFASLGIPAENIFTGYDAVDNEYFASKADEVKGDKEKLRVHYRLPQRYFLSLGRLAAKKNLCTLIRAFRLFLDASPIKQTHLVMVGSGEEEPTLRSLCLQLGLPIYDHSASCILESALSQPGVHFYGFRQIEENPIFYALADAFVLPSLYEEWGLVVNEAMASGLPVVVSETAGCAEDLLETYEGEKAVFQERPFCLERFRLSQKIRRNGFVFDPRSSDELSRVLLFLESSPDVAANMGQAGRRIVGKFSCDNFAKNALLAVEAAMVQSARMRTSLARANR
jgi:glycosyltransferase involved in cell wall biosynthesis